MRKQMKEGCLERTRRSSRRLGLLLLLAATPALTGCYGHFPLTRHVYDLNDDFIDERFVHTGAMWIPGIIAYPVAMLVDISLFNAVQFWTGNITQIGSAQGEETSAVTSEPNDPGARTALQ